MSFHGDSTADTTPAPAEPEPEPSTVVKAEPSVSLDPTPSRSAEPVDKKQEPSPTSPKAPASEQLAAMPLTAPTVSLPNGSSITATVAGTAITPKMTPEMAQPQKSALAREPSGTPVSETGSSATGSRINKNDALNYLDQVKTQFQGQPEVYNKFLEIMKEFKAHLIDTNAVIERVSSLFAGHPNLIEGFNTFLPQEHRIKLHKSIAPSPALERATPESHANYLPPGFRPPPSDYYMPSLPGVPQLRANSYYSATPPQAPGPSSSRLMGVASKYGTNWPADTWPGTALHPSQPGIAYGHQPTSTYQPPGPPIPGPPAVMSAAAAPSVAGKPPSSYAAGPLPQPTSGSFAASVDASAASRKPSMGMIQAVSYLRKIQERFYKQPEIYQSFVEILRSYQKEQKPIRDVYLQVSNLFGNHLDLLEEFTQFIPDAQGLFQGRPGPASVAVESPGRPGLAYAGRLAATGPAGFEGAATASTVPSLPYATGGSRRGRGSSVRGGALKRPMSPNTDGYQKRSKFAEGSRERPMGELEFFDRVKRHLNHNDQLYSEFLKCLNWYTQDILKKFELVKVAHSFIGRSEELFSWLKNFIGYTEGDTEAATQNGDTEVTTDAYLLDLSACKRVGSYRIFPKNYQQPVCSGRTPLCAEICNDQLVSCPTFNSEDSTFVSSRKNIFEEALFRCEDDRYELDRLIDANQATIANFEPILKKIQSMSQKEADKFTLTDTLGGSSEVIYRNAIQKVYGPRADEILAAIKKSPAVSIAIVLKRLKQKDEEWRSAQRDWNKIWREVHFKNYYKALDNQGVNFKTSDRKTLSTKSLVNEIQTVYFEQLKGNLASTVHLLPSSQGLTHLQKSPAALPSSFVSSLSSSSEGLPYQLDFKIADTSVFEDLLKLALYLTAKSSAFSNSERKSLDKFMVNFLPDFFSMKAKVEHGSPLSDREDSGMDDSSNERPDSFGYHSSVLLEPASEKKTNSSAAASNASLVFANENVYVIFRLFQIAYHRLEQMKTLSSSFQDNPVYQHKKNYIASFLDIQKKASGSVHANSDYYSVLLEMIKQLMEGSLESNNFEEKIRLMFGSHAFLMFTFDRVLYTLLKQVLAILGDATSEHIIALYDSFKRPKKGSVFSEYSYKVAARSLVGHDSSANLFRIEAQRGETERAGPAWWLKFRYLPSQSISASEGLPLSAHEKWSLYVDQFVDVHYDPSLLSRKPPLLLVKQLKSSSPDRLKDMIIQYSLECKICVNTFKMFFVDDSEDFIYKPPAQERSGSKEEQAASGYPSAVIDKYPTKCVERFERWLQQRYAEMNGGESAAAEVKMEVD